MGISDIKHANSVRKLFTMIKDLPLSISTNVIKVFTIKNNAERMSFLKTLPEETLKYLLKASVYFVLSSGVLAKETVHEIYLTPEIKNFLDKVKAEIDKAGELTKETVSNAVDVVLGTASVVMFIGLISISVFLMLNPPVGGAVLGTLLLFPEMLIFLIPNKKKE